MADPHEPSATQPMNVELLIHAIVRQTTILIAQLATSDGIRAPLAHIADQVFADLVGELDRQGVSRKVSADMFGMGLRTYRRKVHKLRESSTVRGRSLWETLLAYVREQGPVGRNQILRHFSNDDEMQVKALLHDLCDSQLVVSSVSRGEMVYRIATTEETAALHASGDDEVADDLLVAVMNREGPLTVEQIAAKAQVNPSAVEERLAELLRDGRIQSVGDGEQQRYRSEPLIIPLGASAGWEGAVFDHYKALVSTIVSRLRNRSASNVGDQIGGSTYTLEVWPGHPYEQEVRNTLGRLRASLSDMRGRVSEYNESQGIPSTHTRVAVYVGQSLTEEEGENGD